MKAELCKYQFIGIHNSASLFLKKRFSEIENKDKG